MQVNKYNCVGRSAGRRKGVTYYIYDPYRCFQYCFYIVNIDIQIQSYMCALLTYFSQLAFKTNGQAVFKTRLLTRVITVKFEARSHTKPTSCSSMGENCSLVNPNKSAQIQQLLATLVENDWSRFNLQMFASIYMNRVTLLLVNIQPLKVTSRPVLLQRVSHDTHTQTIVIIFYSRCVFYLNGSRCFI